MPATKYPHEPEIHIAPPFVRAVDYREHVEAGRRLVSRTIWFIDRRGEEDADTDTWEEPV